MSLNLPERTEEDWKRLALAVRTRREELGLTQEQAAARSGGRVSRAVWSNIERAAQTEYRSRTFSGVTTALGWVGNSIYRIFHGQDPVVDEAPGFIAGFEDADWKRIGQRIEAGRIETGQSIEEITDDTGIAPAEWRAIERGEVQGLTATRMATIAHALDWSTDAVLKMIFGAEPDTQADEMPDIMRAALFAELELRVKALEDQLGEVLAILRAREGSPSPAPPSAQVDD